jgi:DNA (cytosine-5)-methyltransferase 1
LKANPKNLPFGILARIVELAVHNRADREAYFTSKSLITEMLREMPPISDSEVTILEPSVGTGNFIPLVAKLFDDRRSASITAVDCDQFALDILDILLGKMKLPNNVTVTTVCEDFLSNRFLGDFDLCIGNPPFSKAADRELLKEYRSRSVNKTATNTSAFFIEKAVALCDNVVLIMPKFLLNTPEYAATRELLAEKQISAILDFGEKGFKGVLVETVALSLRPGGKPKTTTVVSIPERERRITPQSYILDPQFPYWLIYRDVDFDEICQKLEFGIFTAFRDRQMTNAVMTLEPEGNLPVIRSRNISEDGSGLISLAGYDSHIHPDTARHLSVYQFLNKDDVYLTPNMTYKPRVVRKPAGTLVNGSAAILSLVEGQPHLTNSEMSYFASNEYRQFYRTARNRQTRSLNVDSHSVYFFGRYRGERTA